MQPDGNYSYLVCPGHITCLPFQLLLFQLIGQFPALIEFEDSAPSPNSPSPYPTMAHFTQLACHTNYDRLIVDSVEGTVIGLRAGRPRNHGSMPHREKSFFLYPEDSGARYAVYSTPTGGSFLGDKPVGV